MDKKVAYRMLYISIVSFSIVAVSLMMLYGGKYSNTLTAKMIFCGILFWAFLLIGIIYQILLSKYVKVWKRKNIRMYRSLKKHPKIGLISFFMNQEGSVSDVTFILSLAIFLISCIVSDGESIVCYISFGIVFLSFCLHCIFNGKNYFYLKNSEKIKELYRNQTEVTK